MIRGLVIFKVILRKVSAAAMAVIFTMAVLAAGFLFAGCSRGSSPSGAASTLGPDFFNAEIKGEITVSAYDSMTYRNYLEEAAELFETRFPDIKVKIETFSAMPEIRTSEQGNIRVMNVQSQNDPQGRSDYLSRVNTNMMSNTGADVYAMDILPLQKFSVNGNLENLNPYMETDPGFDKTDYRQNILDALRYHNGTWFLPLDYTFNYYAYDTTLIPAETALNFGPDKAWNSDELFKIGMPLYTGTCKLFNTMDYVQRPAGMAGMFSQLLGENIKSFVNLETKTANFTDGKFSGLLESVKRYGEEGYIPRGVTGQQNAGEFMQRAASVPTDRFFFKLNSNFSLVSRFSRGSGRIIRMEAGGAPGIEEDDEIAGIEAIAGGLIPFRYNQGYGINAQSKNKAAAWAFLKFLLAEEMSLSTGLNAMGLPLNNKAREEKAELIFSGAFMGLSGAPLNAQQRQGLENYKNAAEKLSDSINTFVIQDTSVNDMIAAEVQYFFSNSRTAEEVARVLQNKVDLYLNE